MKEGGLENQEAEPIGPVGEPSSRDGETGLAPAGEVDSQIATEASCNQPAPSGGSWAAILSPGTLVNRYRILAPLGRGGMGEVYLALDTRLGRQVALKILRQVRESPRNRTRFEREARTIAGLDHPNLVTLYEIGEYERRICLVTEYVAGENLAERLRRAPALSLREILEITIQLTEALHAAHELGIVHRDIKPENVMIRADGRVKLFDFGLARIVDEERRALVAAGEPSLTEVGVILGTIPYMSPEQARGLEVDRRTDIFSLGVLLYQLLTNRRPFTGETRSDLIVSILTNEPPPLSPFVLGTGEAEAAELSAILARALAKRRAERYQHIGEFETALRHFARRITTDRDEIVAESRPCPACGEREAGRTGTCRHCGQPLVRSCPGCGTVLPDAPVEVRFCFRCGREVDRRERTDSPGRFPLPVRSSLVSEGERPRRERRIVTALMVEILIRRVDGRPIEVESQLEILVETVDRLARLVAREEGSLASLVGNRVLVFFGTPVSHEDDAWRAVRTALEMIGEVRSGEWRIELRAGVHTGLIITGERRVGRTDSGFDHALVGETVELAARLQAAADPGTVRISAETRTRLPEDLITASGTVPLAGSSGPLHSFQISPSDPGATSTTSTTSGTTGPNRFQAPLSGRDAEMAILRESASIVASGRGRLVTLIGEPGLGKSRLIAEWRNTMPAVAGTANPTWIIAACRSDGEGHPGQLIATLIRALLGEVEPEGPTESEEQWLGRALDRLIATARRAAQGGSPGPLATEAHVWLRQLLRREGTTDPPVEPQIMQRQCWLLLRQLLEARAAQAPLVIILEDLHWADAASVELLAEALHLVTTLPLLLCLVTRPAPTVPGRRLPGWHLIERARQELGASLTEINLRELAADDCRRLIDHLRGTTAIPNQLRQTILDRADGNPLFIEEIVRSLRAQGSGSPLATPDIPRNLRGLLTARIDQLPGPARELLRLAAVFGRQFEAERVGRIAGASDLATALAQLETAGLIRKSRQTRRTRLRTVDEYEFRHALIHEAAADSLPRQDRRDLHRLVAASLEAERENPVAGTEPVAAETLAWHFEQAEIPDRAFHYLRLAGDLAGSIFANQEALSFYERARRQLAAWRTTPTAGDGATLAFLDAQSLQLRERIIDLRILAGENRLALDELAALQKELGEGAGSALIDLARLHRKAGGILTVLRQFDLAATEYEQAGALLTQLTAEKGELSGNERVEKLLLHLDDALRLYYLPDLAGAWRQLRLAEGLLATHGTRLHRARYLFIAGSLRLWQERYRPSDATLEIYQESFQIWQESGLPVETGFSIFALAFGHLWRGELEKAGQYLLFGLGKAELANDQVKEIFYLTYLSLLSRRLGDAEKVEHYTTRLLEATAARQLLTYHQVGVANLAWLAWRAGDREKTHELARTAIEYWQSQPTPYPFEWTARWPLLAAHAAAGELAAALAVARPMFNQLQQELEPALGATLEQAITSFDLGRLAAARQLLSEALAMAETTGYI